jgi:hypothetical protein
MEGSTAGLHRVPKVFQQHYNTTVSLAKRREGQRGSSSSITTTKTNVQHHKSSAGPTLQRLDEIPLRSLGTGGEEASAPLLGGRRPDDSRRRKHILSLGTVESRGRHRRYFCGDGQSSRHTSAPAPHRVMSLARNSRADTKRNRVGQLLREVREIVGQSHIQEQKTVDVIRRRIGTKQKQIDDRKQNGSNVSQQRDSSTNKRSPNSLDLSMQDYDSGIRRVERRATKHLDKLENWEQDFISKAKYVHNPNAFPTLPNPVREERVGVNI